MSILARDSRLAGLAGLEGPRLSPEAAGLIVARAAQRQERSEAETEQLIAARVFEKQGRQVAQALSGKFAWRTVLWFVGVLAGAGTVAALTISGHLSYWAAVPINAILIYGIFATLHEAVHDNVVGRHRKLRVIESLIGHVSGFVLLAPYPGFRALHLHHHQHTNDPDEDPDYWVKSNNYLMVILRCMVIQPVYILHLWKIARNPVVKRAFVFEMIYVFSYIPIIMAAYALGWGTQVMLLWILPGYIGVALCPLMFDWPVHHPHDSRGRYTGTAILLFPKPIRAFMEILFLGHSYHLMHHLFPRIPFYHYAKAYYALETELGTVGAKVSDLSFGH